MTSPLHKKSLLKAVPFVLAGFAAYGVWLLHKIIVMPEELVVWLGVAVLLALRVFAPSIARFFGAVIVPVVALLGANGLWAQLDQPRPRPLIGLAIAAVFIGLVVWVYLHSWWVRSAPRFAGLWVLGVVLTLVVAPPVVAYAVNPPKEDEALPGEQPVSRLDVTVVRAGAPASELKDESIDGWQVRYSTAQAEGTTVRWDGPEAPRPRKDADPVLVLIPEETVQPREVKRWLAIADDVADRQTPTLALLPANDRARVDDWSTKLNQDAQVGPRRRYGQVLSLDELGSRSIGDLALRFAATAPTAETDLALAARHRPALLFDGGEKYATPLNIDSLLSTGALRLCPNDQPGLALLCTEINGSGDLRNGRNHLEFETKRVATATTDSTIYVQVTSLTAERPKTIYLDYWWYLPENPSYAADGALCGAGFVIVGVTCFDHQSDWEGVTVVLDARSEPPSPKAVHYAAHGFITRFRWSRLRELWRRLPPGTAAKVDATGIDTAERPLVFIARGTHAAYPEPCRGDDCRQPNGLLAEERYNGDSPWGGNAEAGCALICLAPLPTRRGGRERARWNAYDGRWGTSDCDFLHLCNSSDAPRTPGAQPRYRKPWCPNREGTSASKSRKLPRCVDPAG